MEQFWINEKDYGATCNFSYNINKFMNNKNIDILLNNPEIKLLNEIKEMESNKMIFPKW